MLQILLGPRDDAREIMEDEEDEGVISTEDPCE